MACAMGFIFCRFAAGIRRAGYATSHVVPKPEELRRTEPIEAAEPPPRIRFPPELICSLRFSLVPFC